MSNDQIYKLVGFYAGQLAYEAGTPFELHPLEETPAYTKAWQDGWLDAELNEICL